MFIRRNWTDPIVQRGALMSLAKSPGRLVRDVWSCDTRPQSLDQAETVKVHLP
jgi:hypothetical protein